MTSASAAIPQPGRTKAFLRLVMIEHSIFALPFAYIAALTAMFQLDGNVHWVRLLLVTVCMVGLRTFAMAVNRIIDREIDARNPRTAHRELVTGAMSVKHAWTGALIAVVIFLGSAALLNPLCLALAPVAVIPMVVYPYGKRFTNYPQAILGLAQSMGPVGGWLAITGEWSWDAVVLGLAVGIWIGGFDLIYACQDVESDRESGVLSVPPLRHPGGDLGGEGLPRPDDGPVRLVRGGDGRGRVPVAGPGGRRGRVLVRALDRAAARPVAPEPGVLLRQRVHRHCPVRVCAAGSSGSGSDPLSTVRPTIECRETEADVTISDSDRLHSQLARYEDMFRGYRMEIVEGNIVMSPLRPFHNETIMRLWTQLEAQLGPEWGFISDVAIPFSDDFEFCPDLALIPAAEKNRNLTSYAPDLIELAIEVVSPSSVRNDYEVKNKQYASRGIPNYLIFDPQKAHLVTLWNPGPDGYRGRDTLPYGGKLTVETKIGRLTVDSSRLPVDPGSPSAP